SWRLELQETIESNLKNVFNQFKNNCFALIVNMVKESTQPTMDWEKMEIKTLKEFLKNQENVSQIYEEEHRVEAIGEWKEFVKLKQTMTAWKDFLMTLLPQAIQESHDDTH